MSRLRSHLANWRVLLALMVLPSWWTAGAASVPVWDATSTLTGNHFPGSPNGGAGTGTVPMGPIPGTAAKLAPFAGTGNLIAFGVGGSTRAKGGAGHTQGSNKAKITFPSGTGVDQADPVGNIPHNNASIFQMDFNFKWDITAGGTFGAPINGTFAIPIGAKVAAGGSASFEYEVHWDAVVSGSPMFDIRPAFVGGITFSSPGTYLTSVTSGAAVFTPAEIPSAAGNEIIVRGFLRFKADNDTAPVLIEILGPDVVNDSASNFFEEFSNPSHPLFPQTQDLRFIPDAGFDEVIPEPSSMSLLLVAAAGLLRRRRAT